jgi:vacuolar-type H+-ATPase subunit I/STV1
VSQSQADANTVSLSEVYKLFLQKEKALYTSLNKLKKEDKLFLGYCWIPRLEVQKVLKEIEDIKEKNKNVEVPTFKLVNDHGIRPPSLFRLNEFTFVF